MTERRPCKRSGCPLRTAGLTGYCSRHVNEAHQCVIEDCKNRVSAYSRSHCCADHRSEAVMRKRKGLTPWD